MRLDEQAERYRQMGIALEKSEVYSLALNEN